MYHVQNAGGKVQIRKTKNRRNYYICENNPATCDYISWNKPKKGEKYAEQGDAEEIAKATAKRTTSKRTRKTGAKRKNTTNRK